MRRVRRTYLGLAAVCGAYAAVVVACGGDDATTSGGDDGGAGSDATIDGGAGNDSGGFADTSTGNDSGQSDTGSGGDDASATDAPADVALVDGGGTVLDAGPGGDAAVINCGTASCKLPAQTCCFYPLEFPPPPYYSACSSGATCPALDAGIDAGAATELKCESQDNCVAGTVCCITAPSSGGIAAHCVAPGSCVTTVGTKTAYLCDPTAADAGCADAGVCSSTNIGTWNLPSGFGTCGGVAK